MSQFRSVEEDRRARERRIMDQRRTVQRRQIPPKEQERLVRRYKHRAMNYSTAPIGSFSYDFFSGILNARGETK